MLLREHARPAVVREHRMAPWLAVVTACFGVHGSARRQRRDSGIPRLAAPVQCGPDWRAVVSLAYLLTLVVLLVPVGRWSDRVRPQAASNGVMRNFKCS